MAVRERIWTSAEVTYAAAMGAMIRSLDLGRIELLFGKTHCFYGISTQYWESVGPEKVYSTLASGGLGIVPVVLLYSSLVRLTGSFLSQTT